MSDTVPKRRVQRLSVIVAALVSGPLAISLAIPAAAVPAPEVEYTYNLTVRRHFTFPHNDALSYGFALCNKVSRGVAYRDVMAAVKAEVFPNDEQAANYVVSYAVGLLCPAQIAQLRQTAANDGAFKGVIHWSEKRSESR